MELRSYSHFSFFAFFCFCLFLSMFYIVEDTRLKHDSMQSVYELYYQSLYIVLCEV